MWFDASSDWFNLGTHLAGVKHGAGACKSATTSKLGAQVGHSKGPRSHALLVVADFQSKSLLPENIFDFLKMNQNSNSHDFL